MAAPESSGVRPLVVGANHRSSSMMLRDRLFVEEHAMPGFLEQLRQAGIEQAMVLSTCDRVEVQAMAADRDEGARRIVEVLAQHAVLRPSDLDGQLYVLWDREALRHVFSVTSSLDSLMIGEPQVLGQVKDAHRVSQDSAMAGSELESVLRAAYATAKKVRSETGIGERPVSMAAAAARIARDLHGDLARCGALLVGGSDMGELVARDLLDDGLGRLVVAHPTEARAEIIARAFGCHTAAYESLEEQMVVADIVLTSMGTRRRVITVAMVERALKRRRRKPIFLVDTGIPGDVEPAVNDIDGAFLYDLNDLERVAMEGRAIRVAEAGNAWKIVDAAMVEFERGQAERAAVPSLTRLRRHFEDSREKALADAGGDADKATRLLINRLLHDPSGFLRGVAGGGRAEDMAEIERLLARVFGYDKDEEGSK